MLSFDFKGEIENLKTNLLLCHSVELTWDPYLDLKDCDRGGRNCTTTGIMAEALQFVAKLTNFRVNIRSGH